MATFILLPGTSFADYTWDTYIAERVRVTASTIPFVSPVVAPVVVSTAVATPAVIISSFTISKIFVTTPTLSQFPAFAGGETDITITAEPIVTHNGYDIISGPVVSIFPSGVTASQSLSQDFSLSGQINFMGCDPTVDINCYTNADAGLVEYAYDNADNPIFSGGQAAGQHASVHSVNIFGPPDRYLDYQIYMTADLGNNSFTPVDISTEATILNTMNNAGTVSIAPGGGVIKLGANLHLNVPLCLMPNNSIGYCTVNALACGCTAP